MKRNPIPEDILHKIKAHCEANAHLHTYEIGAWAQAEWPDLFPSTTTPKSTWSRIQREGAFINLLVTLPVHKPPVPRNTNTWARINPELVIPFKPKVQVISDAHFAAHDEQACQRWLQVVEAFKPDYIVWNGDFLNGDYYGHKGNRDAYAAHITDDLQAHAQFMKTAGELSPETQHVMLQGNHDDKALRATDGELGFEGWLRGMWNQWCGGVPVPDDKLTITSRYYAVMAPRDPRSWPFSGPDNFPTLFAHQREYSRLALSVSQRLADVEWCNTVTGHHHHLGVTPHKAGLVWAVDAGTLQSRTVPRYKNARPSTHPKWAQGFITLEHGVPKVWSMLAPDEWWEQELHRLRA